ncbi:unnamed protein product [Durusdinium trenchii]|uniref:CSD domain-containing protein n=1 Tax=Durusdinium trenchii TaxID=1381693 RepID=A0ABP0LTM3_9DINO
MRLMNAPLPKAGADAQSRPNEEPRNEMPRLEKPHAPVAKAETFDGRPSPNMSGGGSSRYTGVLKVFKQESGYGFIDCEELKKLYGCDVFMNQGIEGGIVVGSIVSFTIELDKNGRPQAREARLEADKENEDDQGDHRLRIGDALGKVFKGTVKSFNVSRGFGFLTAPELQRLFPGKDVYVAQTQVPDNRPLTSGFEVEFTLHVTQQGQPQAKDLKLMNTSPELDYLGEPPTAESVGHKLLSMLS